jgi:hypothetical protein
MTRLFWVQGLQKLMAPLIDGSPFWVMSGAFAAGVTESYPQQRKTQEAGC